MEKQMFEKQKKIINYSLWFIHNMKCFLNWKYTQNSFQIWDRKE